MKYLISIMLLFFCTQVILGQNETILEKGVVSYVTSQNVYVKFTSTEYINKGDTLFTQTGDKMAAALLVKDKSSTSCVCTPLLIQKMKAGDVFFSKSVVQKKVDKAADKKAKKDLAIAARDSTIRQAAVIKARTSADQEDGEPVFREKIKGRISAASYSSFSGADEAHRMRYTLTYQGSNLKNSRFSTDNYISFRHTLGEWNEVKEHFSDALKVYSLSVKYDFDKTSSISLGRKINYRIASMGAIDGVQYEKGFGRLLLGAIGGWRPDYTDYGFDKNLIQAGAYVSYASGKGIQNLESTLAFVEQRNHLKTDRRFVYFQHTNTLSKSLNMFASFEVDLYQNINNEATNTPTLTNMLLSLRYKASRRIGLSLSYDNRKNIIYYESYKNYIDQLIEDETRQGLRLGGNYRISKWMTWGFNASWRFQKSDFNLSKNINTYLNVSRLPWVNATASISANLLQTNYLDSKIYGARISKELIRNKLQSDVYYRLVEYDYKNYDYKILQHISGVDFAWYITRKLAFHVYFEGTFDKKNKPFNRFNAKVIQRF